MEIEGSNMRLGTEDRWNSLLTRLELPAGPESGGLLVPVDGGLVFLLFDDEDLAVGDQVALPSGSRFDVTSVRHARMGERPVTALGVRPR